MPTSFAVLIACAHLERADFCYMREKECEARAVNAEQASSSLRAVEREKRRQAAHVARQDAADWRERGEKAERCGRLVWRVVEGEKVA